MSEFNTVKYYNENIGLFTKKAKVKSINKECVFSNSNKTLTVYTGETVETSEGLIPDSFIFSFTKPFKRRFEKMK